MTQGQVTRGQVTQGQVTRGQVTQRQVTRGQVTKGQMTRGQVTQGQVIFRVFAGIIISPNFMFGVDAGIIVFWLLGLFRLWDLHQYEKPELVSMNCLKESFGDGLELEIQTSGPRKIAKRAFLVGGILVGIRLYVMSKIWNSSPSGTRAQDHPRNFCSGQNA